MGTGVSKVGISESESFWPSFTRSIKRKGQKKSSKPTAFSSSTVEISPACIISGESKALVRIVSISRDGEFIPVILSSAGKAISDERQPTKTKKKKKQQLGFDAAEIKVKSRNSDIYVETREPEVCSGELAPKQIPEKEDEFAVKMPDRRSWVRIAQAFRFPKAPDFHLKNRNETKVSQNPIRRRHEEDTKTSVIKQQKAQEIRQRKEVAVSIPGPVEQPSKSSRTSAVVDSKSRKLWQFINFQRKVRSHANKSRGIKSAPLSRLPCPDMNSTAPNSQPKKLNTAERKGTITGNAIGETEKYNMAINLSVLIVIMACLVLFSNRLLAILCTSIWWYLLPCLLKINRASAANGVNSGGLLQENISGVLALSAVPFNGANIERTMASREAFAGMLLWCSDHFTCATCYNASVVTYQNYN